MYWHYTDCSLFSWLLRMLHQTLVQLFHPTASTRVSDFINKLALYCDKWIIRIFPVSRTERNSDNSLAPNERYSVPNSNRRWSLKFKLIFFYQQSRWHCLVISEKKNCCLINYFLNEYITTALHLKFLELLAWQSRVIMMQIQKVQVKQKCYFSYTSLKEKSS